jgi:hypothetical protein
MTVYEYNHMDFEDRHHFLFGASRDINVKFISFRDVDDKKYSLWDCGDFFIEMCAINEKTISFEGIELTDNRINLYIDWLGEHKDDPKRQID